MYQADEKRYEEMKYNRCGASGLLLPAVSLGLWHNFGSNGNFDNMQDMCHTALTMALHILIWQTIMDLYRAVRRRILDGSLQKDWEGIEMN